MSQFAQPQPPARGGSLAQKAARLRAELEAKKTEARAATPGGGGTVDDANPGQTEQSVDTVGQGDFVVRDGDCMLSIARKTGHFWEKLWTDPNNADLRRVRGKPHQLLEGDRVHVPARTPKTEPGATEARHRFVRRGEPSQVRLYLKNKQKPYANEPYTFEVDGKVHEGVTDANGGLVINAPGDSQRGILRIRGRAIKVSLGRLDPIKTSSGIRQRLRNLGFDPGPPDTHDPATLAAALRAFQRKQGLAITGDPDDETLAKLEELHDRGKQTPAEAGQTKADDAVPLEVEAPTDASSDDESGAIAKDAEEEEEIQL